MYTQRTFVLKEADAQNKWYHIDAEGLVVGRLASEIAKILTGKNSASFTPNADSGAFVIITNCEKVVFTGKKMEDKVYFWHTNHIGGIKQRTAKEQFAKHPELVITDAVRGMLPKTSLGRKQITKLKVYKGANHPHEAQKPETYKVK